MAEKYPVITLCGSTRFRKEFETAQKQLTLQGCIVISVGLFGHTGDSEVWENMDEGTKTQTKMMLDDMHKSKIDMADEIYVINPGGYIGESTWSEICYTSMLEKNIRYMEPIKSNEAAEMVQSHISRAEELAIRQLDELHHSNGYYNPADYVSFKFKKETIYDPWLKEDSQGVPFAWQLHDNQDIAVDPFEYYGKIKTARFIEDIIMKHGIM